MRDAGHAGWEGNEMTDLELLALVAEINEADYDINLNEEWPLCFEATGTCEAINAPEIQLLCPERDGIDTREGTLKSLSENVFEQADRFLRLGQVIDSLRTENDKQDRTGPTD